MNPCPSPSPTAGGLPLTSTASGDWWLLLAAVFLVILAVAAVLLLRPGRRRALPLLLALVLAGGGLVSAAGPTAAADCGVRAATPGDRAVVLAVIDNGLSPYHYDFLASRMPQAGTAEALPLNQGPNKWLKGFPAPTTFASYQPLALTLPGADPAQTQASLYAKDSAQWGTVKPSGGTEINYRWIPGTKIIGALTFGNVSPKIYANPGPHGMGTSSVATGDIHGTCPECLLVFIQYSDQASAEAALSWALSQPWIDAISNSYGFSTSIVLRDRIYNGTDVALEKRATDRGQVVFFSAGNGLENAFTIPNSTLLSSEEGPDWVVAVGGTSPAGNDFTGTGKPAKVAGIGYGYPSAYGSTTVSNGQDFSGTSNATPEVAGIYAHALYLARHTFGGASRIQAGGVVASGPPRPCGAATAACALGDGVLTALELRNALYHAGSPTAGHFEDGVTGVITTPVAIADSRSATEGYGTFRGLLDGRPAFEASIQARLMRVLTGDVAPPSRPAGEIDWFRVDSWCRQHIWGTWTGGAYSDSSATPLPSADPVGWPIRSVIQAACPTLQQPPKT